MPAVTEAQKALNFTKEQGIEYQARHLKEMQSVLTQRAYYELDKRVKSKNSQAIDGFDITRGQDIMSILLNDVIPIFYDGK